MAVLIKVNLLYKLYLPYNPAFAVLSICVRNMKTYFHTKTCTQMFVAVLFLKAPNKNHLDTLPWVEQTVAHPYHGMLFSKKKTKNKVMSNLDKHQGNYAE